MVFGEKRRRMRNDARVFWSSKYVNLHILRLILFFCALSPIQSQLLIHGAYSLLAKFVASNDIRA